MRTLSKSLCAAVAIIGLAAVAAGPAFAACTKLGFSVNDYGKDGPTQDAKDMLDKYIAKTMGERGIATYRTGKKEVTCELFLDFIVFDEHTCRADATVCWDDTPLPKGQEAAEGAVAGPAKKAAAKPAAATPKPAAVAKAQPVKAEPAAQAEIAPVEATAGEAAKAAAEAAPAEPAAAVETVKAEPPVAPVAADQPVSADVKPQPLASEPTKAEGIKTQAVKTQTTKTESAAAHPAAAAAAAHPANGTTTGSIAKKPQPATAAAAAKAPLEESYTTPTAADVGDAVVAPAEPAAADDVPPVEAVAP